MSNVDNFMSGDLLSRTEQFTSARGPLPEFFLVENIRPSEVSREHLVSNFLILLEDVNVREALDIFDFGFLQIGKRRQMKRELRSVFIGLWHLALSRSFPQQHYNIFQTFMEQEAQHRRGDRKYAQLTELTLRYVDKLQEHGDSDFSSVSRHLLSLMDYDETRTKILVLKLALYLRRIYVYFFNNLL